MHQRTLRGICLLVMTACAGAAAAQPHSEGWLVSNTLATGVAPVGVVSPSGVYSTVVASLPSVLYFVESAVMDVNNRSFVMSFAGRRASVPKLMIADLSGTILTTFTVAAEGATTDVVVGQDGDYIVAWRSSNNALPAILRVTRSGVVSTIVTGGSQPRGLLVDIDTGDFIVADKVGGSTTNLLRVSRDGSTVGLIASFPAPILAQIDQDYRSGDYFVATASVPGFPVAIARVANNGALSTFRSSPFPYGASSLSLDRASAALPSVVFTQQVTAGELVLRADLGTGAVTTIAPRISADVSHIVPMRGNNLTTRLVQPNDWEITVDIPSDAGRAYFVGLSLSGTRPGVPLPDGRVIPLVVDPFTTLGLAGLLAPYFVGQSGVLGATGRARAFLRTATLPGLSGARVWLTALTLDPNAPLGVRTITDPCLVIL